jgi:hypothetical protein
MLDEMEMAISTSHSKYQKKKGDSYVTVLISTILSDSLLPRLLSDVKKRSRYRSSEKKA